jgi:hypothetical protein
MPQIEQMRGPLFLSTTALGSLKGALSFVFMTLTSFDFGESIAKIIGAVIFPGAGRMDNPHTSKA